MNLLQSKTINWLARGDTGLSSENMAFLIAFGIKKVPYYHPEDPADFDRCLWYLDAVPEAREKMNVLSERSPQWAALIERWAEVEESHIHEVGLGWTKSKHAPKTYKLIREIVENASLKGGK